jgi:hypothetical protein
MGALLCALYLSTSFENLLRSCSVLEVHEPVEDPAVHHISPELKSAGIYGEYRQDLRVEFYEVCPQHVGKQYET